MSSFNSYSVLCFVASLLTCPLDLPVDRSRFIFPHLPTCQSQPAGLSVGLVVVIDLLTNSYV